MHGENEFLMLDGVLVSITRAMKEREERRGVWQRRIEKFAYADPVLRKSLAELEMCKKILSRTIQQSGCVLLISYL